MFDKNVKMDVTISRHATINTGNYSSIGPSITVTLKDVAMSDIKEAYDTLSELAGALMAKETIALGEETSSVVDMGYKSYIKALIENDERISQTIENFATGTLFE